MTEQNELSDIFRIRYPDFRQFTWRCKNPLKQRRLDYLLISDSLQHKVETISIIPSVQSDHSVLKMKLSSLQERKQGPSYWKFNNSLLYDNTFVTKMKEKIPEFCNESAELNDIMLRWEFLNYRIRQFSSEFSKQKAVERKASRSYLERKVKNLEIQLNSDCSEELLLEYNRSKDELESLYNYITEGIILRLESVGMNMGRSPLNIFLTLRREINQSLK